MPRFRPIFIKSYQTNGSADAEDSFDFVSSIDDQVDEPLSISEHQDPIEELADNQEVNEGHDPYGAVLDFELTGNEDWGSKAFDDFLF